MTQTSTKGVIGHFLEPSTALVAAAKRATLAGRTSTC